MFFLFLIFFDYLLVESFEEEPVFISAVSTSVEKIEWDGKWTFVTEWKQTSQDKFEGVEIYIRSAHFKNNVYILIDALWDTSIEKGSDRAIICFDTMNDKSIIPQEDDYCFQATLGRQNGATMQGGSMIPTNGNFKNIKNDKGFIAIGNVSDENDRYFGSIHASYEFRIPTEVIGRSDNYGFLVFVYDANTNQVVTWPSDIEINERKNIPSPSQWGSLISPDKSLPEFEIPFLIMFSSILSLVIISKFVRLDKIRT